MTLSTALPEPLQTVQCATCGVERDPADLPEFCPICADERQYLPPGGIQQWTSPGRHPLARIALEQPEPGVWHLRQHDAPGIGQTPLVVATRGGNVMIEVPALVSDAAVAQVRAIGGLSGIIASHPHMYGLQSVWSAGFDDCPVYVSRADEQWLGRRPRNTVVWDDEIQIAPDLVATQPGGHFPGSAVVHWTGRDGKGVLFTGDTIVPTPSGWATFMRSYPNQIPLSPAVVRRVAAHVSRYDYDRMYGNFGRSIRRDAAAVVQRSAERYAAWAGGEYDHLT